MRATGAGHNTNVNSNVRAAPRSIDNAEIDTFGENSSFTAASLFQDRVRIGTLETNIGDGFLGARASAFDGQANLGDRVTLSATGPSAEAHAGANDSGFGLGMGVGAGGVAATGRLGNDRNALKGTVGLGLGAGFDVEGSRTQNADGSATRSLNVDAKLLGRVAVGVTWTTPPSSGLSGRNLRGRQLAERRLAEQALPPGLNS